MDKNPDIREGSVMVRKRTMQRPVILVVDDSADNLWMLTQLLALVGFSVRSAKDGQQALELLEDVTPDVILADVQMPVMDGLELARRVRTDRRYRHLPMIAYSGKALNSEKAEMYRAGFDRVLIKPVGLNQLEESIKNTLHLDP